MALNTITKNFIPEIFDASIYRTLEDNLVLKQISNLEPIAVNGGNADTIYFPTVNDPTIGSSSATFTYEDIVDQLVEMKIDAEAIFSFKVRDIDRIMATVDLKGSQADRAGYVIKDTIERAVFQNVGNSAAAGTAVTDASCDSATIISDIGALEQQLAENNVTRDNMWLLIPPWVQLKLKLAGINFSINEGVNGKGGMFWTQDLGFKTFVTNTVYNSGTQANPVSTILAGSYQAIGYADAQFETRALPLEGTRATGLDGGVAYGYKVIKPKELAKATLTYSAETSI